MQKKKYYASRKKMIPLAIFAGILACPRAFDLGNV